MPDVDSRYVQQPPRPSFLPFDEVVANRADAALLGELREMLPETTDDMEDPWEKAARA